MSRDPMPVHKPYRRFIQCTCGERVAAEDYEAHVRRREPEDIGRWIADGALSVLRERIAEHSR